MKVLPPILFRYVEHMHSPTTCVTSLGQGPEFISEAVDVAARELLAVATPGQG